MSFKAELEALIANANSSLADLEAVLRRAQSRSRHGDTIDMGNGGVREIQAQLDTIRQKILSSLLEIRESYNHDQERLADLEGELKQDIENVRQCAIDYFIKGEYRECERLLTFLAKIQPRDENLEKLLDLSRRKLLKNERERSGAAADSQDHSKDGDQDQQLSQQNHDQPIHGTPKTRGDDLEPPVQSAEQTALPLAVGEFGPLPVLEPDTQEQSETIEPQILAEIELKTAAHIDEMYRTLPSSTKPRILVWAVVAAFGVAMTLYWLSRSRPESSVPESRSDSQSEVEKLVPTEDRLKGLRQEAEALFESGELQEAGRLCDAILAKDPQDNFAVLLKDTIRATLAEPKPSTEGVVPSARTAQLDQPLGGESPGAQAANLQVRSQLLASKTSLQPASSSDGSTSNLKRIDGAVQQPSKQKAGEKQLTPAKQAARAPASFAPTIAAANQVAKVPQIRPEQLSELSSRIQAKDFDQARLLLEQLENAFPTSPEVRTLGERLRLEAGKQQTLVSSWIEKAEAAWINGRYVTPPDDNVLVYCNLALKADPRNQRATNLKREIVQRAIAQAKDWIQRGKFDAARLSYASMDYLAVGDDAFPYPKLDLKRELEKLGFRNYSIVHDHRLGSCSGILKFNAYAVSYVPSGGSDDGFAESLNSIVINVEGERLKIIFRDRTFRFRSENGNTVGAIYQQLMNRMTDEKSTLVTRTKDIR